MVPLRVLQAGKPVVPVAVLNAQAAALARPVAKLAAATAVQAAADRQAAAPAALDASMLRRYLRFRRLLDRLTRLRRRIRRLVLVLRRRTSSLMLLSVSRGMIHAVNTNLTNALIIFDILVIRIVVTF